MAPAARAETARMVYCILAVVLGWFDVFGEIRLDVRERSDESWKKANVGMSSANNNKT